MTSAPVAAPPRGGSRALRILGYILLGLLLFIVLAAGIIYVVSEQKLNRTFSVTPAMVPIPSDAASIKRGEHLVVSITKCVDCHGNDLAGTTFLDIPPALIYAPNLTKGKGGLGATLSDADFIRAITHGVAPDGHGLWIMPSGEYAELSPSDLGAIIAYVKSVPAVDKLWGKNEIRPLGRVLVALGQFDLSEAATINHDAPLPNEVTPGPTLEYGRYLSVVGGCSGCHGSNFSGGPFGDPEAPPAANLTPAGEVATWTEADWTKALRQGIRPNGTQLQSAMPWDKTALMTDDEMKALIMYMRTIPAAPTGSH